MKVTTNNRVRPLLCYPELSARDQKDFDYAKDDCTPRFVEYKGQIHDTLDTQVILVGNETSLPMGWAVFTKAGSVLATWHRILSASMWDGFVYRFEDDGAVVGRYVA